MDISVRNLDNAAAAKLTQLAKEKKMSREAYIRSYLETLAVIGDMKELDMKYSSLVKEVYGIIENNTKALNNMYVLLEELKKNSAINSTGEE